MRMGVVVERADVETEAVHVCYDLGRPQPLWCHRTADNKDDVSEHGIVLTYGVVHTPGLLSSSQHGTARKL